MARAEGQHGAELGILSRVARREAEAMKECIDAFGGLVWGIARRFVQPDSETEDVVQEVFAELWQKADRFDSSRASEATFIGLIARGRSIDWLRKRSRRPSLEPLEEGLDVALEDGVVVAKAHLPVGVDVVLEDLLLLWVGQHLHCLLRTVQQRRVQEVVGPPPGQLALPLPLLLVALVEVQVPSVPRVLPQVGVGHLGENS